MKLGLIVPYRNRQKHLDIFLSHMKKYLDKHNIDFHIYIIHQCDKYLFNRAAMLNIGLDISFNCVDYFCLHDIDILVQNTHNIYHYRDNPTNLLKKYPNIIISNNSKLFGGIVTINKKHIKLINGLSNNFWGWGGEDGDFRRRLEQENIKWKRELTAVHTVLSHDRTYLGYSNPQKKIVGNSNIYNIDLLCNLGKLHMLNYKKDGLNKVNYEIVKTIKINEYTSMFNVINKNIPDYDLNNKILHKFVLKLLKDEYKNKYTKDFHNKIVNIHTKQKWMYKEQKEYIKNHYNN